MKTVLMKSEDGKKCALHNLSYYKWILKYMKQRANNSLGFQRKLKKVKYISSLFILRQKVFVLWISVKQLVCTASQQHEAKCSQTGANVTRVVAFVRSHHNFSMAPRAWSLITRSYSFVHTWHEGSPALERGRVLYHRLWPQEPQRTWTKRSYTSIITRSLIKLLW